jgi:SAM-dependent methyltransferase
MLSVQHMALAGCDSGDMNCDRLARWYRLLEYLVFGRALERRRCAYMDQLADVRHALLLGDGDGRFTAELVKRFPLAQVDSVEQSSGMLALAQARLRKLHLDSERIRFWPADARTIDLHGPYDLIATHFFLDCFWLDELRPLIARVGEHCAPGGCWLVSEFGLPDAGWPRAAAGALIWTMYSFFRIATGLQVSRLPEYGPVLEENGFRIHRRCVTAGGLLVSELWERPP